MTNLIYPIGNQFMKDVFQNLIKILTGLSGLYNQQSYKYKYSGCLMTFTEAGGRAEKIPILMDNRYIQKNQDGSVEKKAWDWSIVIVGSEYLKVFKDNSIIWQGKLIKDLSLLMKN